LTRTPWSITQGDIDRLRSVGLTDRAINDATQVISFFNYINRIADGLGVDLEEGMPAPRVGQETLR
jgi:alkylhydroperoxidase family enzyme